LFLLATSIYVLAQPQLQSNILHRKRNKTHLVSDILRAQDQKRTKSK